MSLKQSSKPPKKKLIVALDIFPVHPQSINYYDKPVALPFKYMKSSIKPPTEEGGYLISGPKRVGEGGLLERGASYQEGGLIETRGLFKII